MKSKTQIREAALRSRRELPLDAVREKSARILDNLKPLIPSKLDLAAHVFLSIEKFREIATEPIISHLRQLSTSATIAVPRVDTKTKQLTHHHYVKSDLVQSKWGIWEPPAKAPQIEPEVFDLVLVPMLAFDLKGHRIGYGAGFYDKFLSRVRADCLKVGLCLELGKVDEALPSELFDVALNWIVTEESVYKITEPVS